MENTVTLNVERGQYVIKEAYGYSCLGFANCFRDAVAMAKSMKIEPPGQDQLGTLECYETYQGLLKQFSRHPASQKTWFDSDTPDRVKVILSEANKSFNLEGTRGTILRLFFGDHHSGRDFCEEYDCVGFIGRSSGTMKVPLLLEPLLMHKPSLTAAYGGGAILTSRIVRIIEVNTGRELYRTRNYQIPVFEVDRESGNESSPYGIKRNGLVCAGAKTYEEAMQYVAFAMGLRISHVFRTQEEYRSELEEAA